MRHVRAPEAAGWPSTGDGKPARSALAAYCVGRERLRAQVSGPWASQDGKYRAVSFYGAFLIFIRL